MLRVQDRSRNGAELWKKDTKVTLASYRELKLEQGPDAERLAGAKEFCPHGTLRSISCKAPEFGEEFTQEATADSSHFVFFALTLLVPPNRTVGPSDLAV